MRHVKMALGVGATLCALGIAAVPAGAHQFVASRVKPPISAEKPGKLVVRNIGTQNFRFGGLKIECNKAHGVGNETLTEFKTFAVAVKYGECWTIVKVGPKEEGRLKTSFNKGRPVFYVYHVNGFVEVGGEVVEEEGEVHIEGGETTLFISGFKCTVRWPSQTIPVRAIKNPEAEYSSAVYSNEEVAATNLKQFPSGFQKKLRVANEFKSMKYEEEGGICEEFERKEGHQSRYVGELETELKEGNISVE